ncbi:hypothetical protein [Streptomyces sp. NPDC051098]|uniref:hypothetical protein n=1 Tax=Streptomyces sp. NPDC051098 TaxID=3155411 RepID=UPI00342026FE
MEPKLDQDLTPAAFGGRTGVTAHRCQSSGSGTSVELDASEDDVRRVRVGDDDVLSDPERAIRAIARYSLRDRTRLGLLRVKDGVLVLQQLLAPDEVRSPAVVAPPDAAVDDEEVQGALELAAAFDMDDLSTFTDEYTEALNEIIAAKIEGREAASERREERPHAPVVDLMAALNESVAKARASRGEHDQDATVHDMLAPAAAKKRTAKKTTAAATAKKAVAKKTAAKKTPAKEQAGRKSRSA